jgi:hypothetical protein
MKKSEIKDLYNQSDAALRLLKALTLLLPYSSDQVIAENTMKAAAQAAELWKPVKVMCDYMIDDGSTDMTDRLLNIKAVVINIQNSVLKMAIADSKEAFVLIQNCQAIINTIKDMEEWTANGVEPQHTAPEAENDNFIPLWSENEKENQVPPGIKKVFNTKVNHDSFIQYCYSVISKEKPYNLITKKFAEVRYKDMEEKTDKQHTGATLLFNYLSKKDKEGNEQSAPHLDLLDCSYRTWSRFFSTNVKD